MKRIVWVAAALICGSAVAPAANAKDLRIYAGQCVSTLVSKIGHRLDGTDEFAKKSGSAVTFANGVWIGSYEEAQVVHESRIGDPVLLCTIGTETGCPAGRPPANTVQMINLRTARFWTGGTSSHSCQGA